MVFVAISYSDIVVSEFSAKVGMNLFLESGLTMGLGLSANAHDTIIFLIGKSESCANDYILTIKKFLGSL